MLSDQMDQTLIIKQQRWPMGNIQVLYQRLKFIIFCGKILYMSHNWESELLFAYKAIMFLDSNKNAPTLKSYLSCKLMWENDICASESCASSQRAWLTSGEKRRVNTDVGSIFYCPDGFGKWIKMRHKMIKLSYIMGLLALLIVHHTESKIIV